VHRRGLYEFVPSAVPSAVPNIVLLVSCSLNNLGYGAADGERWLRSRPSPNIGYQGAYAVTDLQNPAPDGNPELRDYSSDYDGERFT